MAAGSELGSELELPVPRRTLVVDAMEEQERATHVHDDMVRSKRNRMPILHLFHD
jgi:hypothetical protein